MSNHSITTLLHRAAEVLAAHSDSPRLDAELLLCQCLGCSRTWLVTWPEHVPEPDQQECFQAAITRRQRGEPVAHILGQREFWSLPLQVTPNTLIPRPETELLVERALEHIPEHTECHILDLGTGSGAIALAIASERPLATLTATDRSTEALEVARANARQLGLSRITFLQADWCEGLPDNHYEVIVSNPPYIPESDIHLTQGDVRFEPRSALVAGHDGLSDLRRILPQAHGCLRPGGWLLVEHGHDQGEVLQALFKANGYQQVQGHKDLAGQDRITLGQRQR